MIRSEHLELKSINLSLRMSQNVSDASNASTLPSKLDDWRFPIHCKVGRFTLPMPNPVVTALC